jgi:hypothetical protein
VRVSIPSQYSFLLLLTISLRPALATPSHSGSLPHCPRVPCSSKQMHHVNVLNGPLPDECHLARAQAAAQRSATTRSWRNSRDSCYQATVRSSMSPYATPPTSQARLHTYYDRFLYDHQRPSSYPPPPPSPTSSGSVIGTFVMIAILSFIGAHYYSKKVN